MKKRFTVGIISLALATSACTSTANNTQTGAAIGAVVGAILGKSTGDHDKSRYVWGAAVGAIAGGAIGKYMDNQEEAFRQELADSGVQVIREGDKLRLVMPGDITFATNSSSINSQFNPVLNDVALVVNKYEKTTLVIKGHTDDVGSDEYNLALSERRAQSVENYLISRAVAPQRMTTVGMGEYQPKVANVDATTRQQNRRVELEIHPITQ